VIYEVVLLIPCFFAPLHLVLDKIKKTSFNALACRRKRRILLFFSAIPL
jgi:hypothetical protein